MEQVNSVSGAVSTGVCLKSAQELEQIQSNPQSAGVMTISEPSGQSRSAYFQFDHLEDTN